MKLNKWHEIYAIFTTQTKGVVLTVANALLLVFGIIKRQDYTMQIIAR